MKLKSGVKKGLIFFAILLLLVIAFFCYQLFFKEKGQTVKEVKIASEIKAYGYVLNEDESKEYKKMFKNLEKILTKEKIDEDAYVRQIATMFVYDFFTLSDKAAKTDVGGKMFVHSGALTNFLDKAENTIYKYIENNLYNTRGQDLPTVNKIEIEKVETVEFPYLETVDENAYQVTLGWDYQEDLGYQDHTTLIFVHENQKLSLVEME